MFDFGNVLVHFDTQRFYNFIKACQSQLFKSRNPEEIFKLDVLSEFDLGKITTSQMFERLKTEMGLNVSMTEFLIQFTEIIKPDPKMLALRQVLRGNNIKVAVVSNTNACHFRYIQSAHPEVFSDFDYLMLSFQHGFKKPDHRMWEVPAKQLSVLPEECFYVDDFKPNICAFRDWSQYQGEAHCYNVVDDKFMPNGWLNIERKRLIFQMANMQIISYMQASKILGLVL